jgi:hypothetical protein
VGGDDANLQQLAQQLELRGTRFVKRLNVTIASHTVCMDAAVQPYRQVLQQQDFQNKIWATRKRPWVDRLASAWIIQKFVDPQAKFIWLEHPNDCPKHALGFDFNHAQFTHINHLVV